MPSHPFESLSPAALRRIATFLEFNPSIPLTKFSQEKRSLKPLDSVRQEEWLDSHREELYREFVQAATPTSTFYLDGDWSYDKILLNLTKYLAVTTAGRTSAEDTEWRLVRHAWQRFREHLPNKVKESALIMRETLGLPLDAVWRQDLLASRSDASCRRAAKTICEVILNYIRRDEVNLIQMLCDKHDTRPMSRSLFHSVFEVAQAIFEDTWQAVEEPNVRKIFPVILEVARDRLSDNASAKNAAPNRPVASSPITSAAPPEPSIAPRNRSYGTSRAEVEKDFRELLIATETRLRNFLPRENWTGKDLRSFGQLIEKGEEAGSLTTRQLDNLRQINRVRNSLYHPGGPEITDAALANAIASLRSFAKTL